MEKRLLQQLWTMALTFSSSVKKEVFRPKKYLNKIISSGWKCQTLP